MPDGPDKDLYDFAYWTCLQLERYVCTFCTFPCFLFTIMLEKY